MFGRSEIKYGYRVGGKDTWCASKKERDSLIRKMNGNMKPSSKLQAKAIQKKVPVTLIKKTPKDKCSGGVCKKNRMCTKHAKKAGSDMDSLYYKGRNVNNIRWDEEGYRG